MLLASAQGQTVSAMAAAFNTNPSKVEHCVPRPLKWRVLRPCEISPDAAGGGRSCRRRTWVVDLACQKPKDLGNAPPRLLAKHIRPREPLRRHINTDAVHVTAVLPVPGYFRCA